VLLGLAALLLAPLHWWWRRRGRSRPPVLFDAGGPARPPLERWADAGEMRAVAAVATARLRSVIARQVPEAPASLDTQAALDRLERARPEWPRAELADLLRSLDEARFGHTSFPDAIGLARWALELEPRLARPARSEAVA
jgi:hypothetical protein